MIANKRVSDCKGKVGKVRKVCASFGTDPLIDIVFLAVKAKKLQVDYAIYNEYKCGMTFPIKVDLFNHTDGWLENYSPIYFNSIESAQRFATLLNFQLNPAMKYPQ